jgi:hypothetical protein
MTLPPTSHAANAAVADQAYALISSDPRLAIAIAELAHATGYPATMQAARPMADLYVHISRIWATKRGTSPFHLKGKDGLWKQVDQQYLADGLNWCLRTVSRNLNKLERIGLIRYERQGYISSKYLQLVSIEQALGNAAVAQCQTSGSDPSPHDTPVSVTYRTRCPVGKGQGVRCAKDTVSVANTERIHRESIDTEDLELSAQRSCTPPVRVDEKIRILEAAVRQYDQLQTERGGSASDADTLDTLLAAAQGLDDDAVALACGHALQAAMSWAWQHDRPAIDRDGIEHTAGRAIGAALNGWLWTPESTHTADQPEEPMHWDATTAEFVFCDGMTIDQGLQPFVPTVPSEAPAALDKERQPDAPTGPVETLLAASDAAISPEPDPAPVKAVLAAPVAPTAPLINLVLETHASQPARAAADDIAGQIAQIKALGIQISKPSAPRQLLDDDGGVGEHAHIWQRPRQHVSAKPPALALVGSHEPDYDF